MSEVVASSSVPLVAVAHPVGGTIVAAQVVSDPPTGDEVMSTLVAADAHVQQADDMAPGVLAASEAPVDEESLRIAAAEGLTLKRSGGKAGYKGVTINRSSKSKPFQVQLWRDNKKLTLGYFATAQEAAVCYAKEVLKEGYLEERERLAGGVSAGSQRRPAHARSKHHKRRRDEVQQQQLKNAVRPGGLTTPPDPPN